MNEDMTSKKDDAMDEGSAGCINLEREASGCGGEKLTLDSGFLKDHDGAEAKAKLVPLQHGEKRKRCDKQKSWKKQKVSVKTEKPPVEQDEPVAGPSGYLPPPNYELWSGAYSSDEEETSSEQIEIDEAHSLALNQEELDLFSPFPGFFDTRQWY